MSHQVAVEDIMNTIVTHTMPDFDAIASVWLLRKFHFDNEATVKYVNTGNPDLSLLNEATAVVDTGRVFDEATLRFDHHQYPDNTICAASLVYDFLCTKQDIEYLSPLIELITWGDTGNSAANMSRNLGIHALLSSYRNYVQKRTDITQDVKDDGILWYGFSLLDTIANYLYNQKVARDTLENHVVFLGKGVISLYNAPQGASQIAAETYNVPLVAFLNDENPEVTVSVGIMRFGESTIHVGQLIEEVQEKIKNTRPHISKELKIWFKHPVGFFAGRGTAKAPNTTQFFKTDFITLCQEIDYSFAE